MDCQDRINLYNQAVQLRQHEGIESYVNKQKELVTAPLQQQIADLNKQMIQVRTDSFNAGMSQGLVFGIMASLLLCGIAFALRRMMRPEAQPKVNAASA
jgi:hypothetical protein